jgi:hypothetical protein
MQWKHTAFVTGATLVGAWMAGTPKAPAPHTTPLAQTATASPGSVHSADNSDISDIEHEAVRLESRVGRRLAGDALPANRNPFRFRDARPLRPAASRVRDPEPNLDDAEAPAAKPLPPPEPPLKLIGMASDDAGGTVVRTAVLSTSQGVALVGMGDAVAGYRVTAIEPDAVELSDAEGRIRRLALKP